MTQEGIGLDEARKRDFGHLAHQTRGKTIVRVIESVVGK